MAVEWFYTTNKQQMGPVSWKELRELAEVGILKPHDQVWSEGMDEWAKAINQQGLFADDEQGSSSGKKASYQAPKPPPGRRTGRREDEEDEDDEEDRKETKRKARKKQGERATMAVGLKVGLILGGGVLVLLFLTCVGGGLIWLAFSGRAGAPVRDRYTVFRLNQGQQNLRQYQFTKGRRVVITVTNNLANPNTDVDLHIFRGNHQVPNEQPIAWDDRLPQEDRHCRVEFVVPANDTYRVQIVNLGPGMANSCVVNVEEF
jgi:hypothetical protein